MMFKNIVWKCCLLQADNENNGEWSINVEQFVATALTVQKMVEFIGQRANISEALSKLRNNWIDLNVILY